MPGLELREFLATLPEEDRRFYLKELAKLTHEERAADDEFTQLRRRFIKGEIRQEVYDEEYQKLCARRKAENDAKRVLPELPPDFAPWASEEEKARDLDLAHRLGYRVGGHFPHHSDLTKLYERLAPVRNGLKRAAELGAQNYPPMGYKPGDEGVPVAVEHVLRQICAPYDDLIGVAVDAIMMGKIGLQLKPAALSEQYRLCAPFRAARESGWPTKWD